MRYKESWRGPKGFELRVNRLRPYIIFNIVDYAGQSSGTLRSQYHIKILMLYDCLTCLNPLHAWQDKIGNEKKVLTYQTNFSTTIVNSEGQHLQFSEISDLSKHIHFEIWLDQMKPQTWPTYTMYGSMIANDLKFKTSYFAVSLFVQHCSLPTFKNNILYFKAQI